MNGIIFILVMIMIEETCYLFYHFWKKHQQYAYHYAQYENEEGTAFTKDELTFMKKEASKSSVFALDDITWNDIHMDGYYQKMNHCITSAGDQQLYAMLREPLQDVAKIEKRHKIIEIIRHDATLQNQLCSPLMAIDSSGKESISALYDGEIPISKAIYVACIALSTALFISCIMLLFYPAMISLVFIFGYLNCVIAFKIHKKSAHAYQSALQLYEYVRVLQRLDNTHNGVLKDYFDWQRCLQKLKKIRHSLFEDFYSGDGFFLLFIANVFLLGPITFYRLASQLVAHKQEVLQAVSICGNIDACLSVSCYINHTTVCDAIFVETKQYHAQGMLHPLIKEPVANDVNLFQSVLVSGSNASGKSTYLKMIALNCILAQCFGYACARTYEASLFHLYTSMSLHDFLEGADSYFMTEIKAMKRIMDAAARKEIILCMIDEILNGTNTGERIAASSEILYSFTKTASICMSATHDIELPRILQHHYHNLHFSEAYEDGEMKFDYKVQEGPANSQNALALLEKLNFPKAIILEANQQIQSFQKTGTWLKLEGGENSHV